MKEIFYFLTKIGQLKGKERKWWTGYGIKNAETTAEHTFHLALLVWVLGAEKKHFNLDKAIKMALLHDLCEVHTKNTTPYDPDSKKTKKLLNEWPNLTLEIRKKKEKEKRLLESEGLKKLISELPLILNKKLRNLWSEYEERSTAESKFVRQSNKVITFLQAIEYWKKKDKIQHKLWVRWIKESIDDPILLSFLEEIENEWLVKK